MTKQEYMSQLQKRLGKLPSDVFDEAMEYFAEYFDEAEDEQTAIENLGSPEEAAAQIITNIAIENASEPEKTEGVKKGLSAIWVGLLAVFAVPVGVPVAFAIGVVILALLVTVASLWLAVALVAVSFVFAGVVSIVGGIILLFSSWTNALASIGAALILLGLGIMIGYASVNLGRWFLQITLKIFAHFAKGGNHNEKE